MKKQPTLVQIPVNHVCIDLEEYRSLVEVIHRVSDTKNQLITARDKLITKLDELTKKLAEASQKIVDLEKEVEAKDESVMFWYHRSNELEDKIKEAANACTEKT